ncbi:MAG TPA: response regulator [Flavobacterium sp.]|jgi:CheY-like chemotaxis protein|uniref:response regulator n=1 Tax=Flavobacterium sp. TaxID=239 RepID=UPI002BDD617E|nr:response regulator [Flavobacterium sp.]MCA0349742.1 response regulator [Bacteroidota bacterium]HPW97717.1 response regulator [Flavobacterium sp.]HQA74876.1 response regulator [Flavobacterium sp.]
MLHKVLCVDDDPITLMLCKKVIERVNYTKEVDTAKNGEDAIAYFNQLKNNQEIPPELVLLDLNMPIMNGWELLDAYLELEFNLIFKETKFIVLSSTIDPSDIEKSKSYPMVIDFISKPITKEILAEIKL